MFLFGGNGARQQPLGERGCTHHAGSPFYPGLTSNDGARADGFPKRQRGRFTQESGQTASDGQTAQEDETS